MTSEDSAAKLRAKLRSVQEPGKIDESGDHVIHYHEFKQFIKDQLGYMVLPSQLISQSTNNNSVDNQALDKLATEENIFKIFTEIDRSNNGTISMHEYTLWRDQKIPKTNVQPNPPKTGPSQSTANLVNQINSVKTNLKPQKPKDTKDVNVASDEKSEMKAEAELVDASSNSEQLAILERLSKGNNNTNINNNDNNVETPMAVAGEMRQETTQTGQGGNGQGGKQAGKEETVANIGQTAQTTQKTQQKQVTETPKTVETAQIAPTAATAQVAPVVADAGATGATAARALIVPEREDIPIIEPSSTKDETIVTDVSEKTLTDPLRASGNNSKGHRNVRVNNLDISPIEEMKESESNEFKFNDNGRSLLQPHGKQETTSDENDTPTSADFKDYGTESDTLEYQKFTEKKTRLGETDILMETECLESRNGRYWLGIYKDGRLAMHYKRDFPMSNDWEIKWVTNEYDDENENEISSERVGPYVFGNSKNKLIIYNGRSKVIWEKNIPKNSIIMVDNSGNLVALNSITNVRTILNCSQSDAIDLSRAPCAARRGNKLDGIKNVVLKEREYLESSNGQYRLLMQQNGNVVLFETESYRKQARILTQHKRKQQKQQRGSGGVRGEMDENDIGRLYNPKHVKWQTYTGSKDGVYQGPYSFGFERDYAANRQNREELEVSYKLVVSDGYQNILWEHSLQSIFGDQCSLVLQDNGALRLQNEPMTSRRSKSVINYEISPLHDFAGLDYIAISEDNNIFGDSKSKDSEQLVELRRKWKEMLNNGNKNIGTLNMSLFRFKVMIIPFWIIMTLLKVLGKRTQSAELRISWFCGMILLSYFSLMARIFNFCDTFVPFARGKNNQICRWVDLCNFAVCTNSTVGETLLEYIGDVRVSPHSNDAAIMTLPRFFVLVLPLMVLNEFISWFDPCGRIYSLLTEISTVLTLFHMLVCSRFLRFLDKLQALFGIQSADASLRSISMALPWKTLFDVFTHTGQNFNRNRLLALTDKIFPVSEVFEVKEQNNGRLDSITISEKDPLYHEARYAVQYAIYAYDIGSLGTPANFRVISGPYVPSFKERQVGQVGYFIGLDEKHNKLLLCLRGTSDIGDIAADLEAYATKSLKIENREYYVHPGIWEATREIDLKVSSLIVQTFNNLKQQNPQKYENLEVIVTGHSLGAGVASLLSIIWYFGLNNNEMTSDINDIKDHFRCYSFASPLIVNGPLRRLVHRRMKLNRGGGNDNIITSFVNQYDIVPRASLRAAAKIQAQLNVIKSKELDAKDALARMKENFKQNPNIARGKRGFRLNKFITDEFVQCELDMAGQQEFSKDETGGSEDFEIKLFPLGTIVWRVPDLWRKSKNIMECYENVYNTVWSHDMVPRIWLLLKKHFTDYFGESSKTQSNYILLRMDNVKNSVVHSNIFHNIVINVNAALYHKSGGYLNMFGLDYIQMYLLSDKYKMQAKREQPTRRARAANNSAVARNNVSTFSLSSIGGIAVGIRMYLLEYVLDQIKATLRSVGVLHS